MKKIARFRIQIIFAIAMVLLLLLSVFSYVRINNLIKSTAAVNHSNQVKLQLERFFSTLKDMESSKRAYLLNNDPYNLNDFNKSIAISDFQFQDLKKIIADNPSQQKNCLDLKRLYDERIVNLKKVSITIDPAIRLKNRMIYRANRLALRAQINKMVAEEDVLLFGRSKSLVEETSLTPLVTIFLIVVSIFVLFVAYYQISRNEKILARRNSLLKERNESLAKMNRELESFTYISSHDLQEPLRKIQTFISRIIDREYESLSDTGKNYLNRTQESANRMQNLIRDLLAYSRLKVEVFPFVTTNLYDLVAEVKNDLIEEITDKDARIEVNGETEIKVILSQFRQLLTNLISNAIKFSDPAKEIKITIENTTVAGNELPFEGVNQEINYSKISVSDNGIGFDVQYADRIFEVFQRLHIEQDYKGTGIGLAIVKKITENHNGFVTADGKINQGATFTMYIPA